MNGPVYVQGASPGDTLQVDVLSVETVDWGWTALIPGFGSLSDEFPEPALKIWKLDKENAWFDEDRVLKSHCGLLQVRWVWHLERRMHFQPSCRIILGETWIRNSSVQGRLCSCPLRPKARSFLLVCVINQQI